MVAQSDEKVDYVDVVVQQGDMQDGRRRLRLSQVWSAQLETAATNDLAEDACDVNLQFGRVLHKMMH